MRIPDACPENTIGAGAEWGVPDGWLQMEPFFSARYVMTSAGDCGDLLRKLSFFDGSSWGVEEDMAYL